MRVLALAVLAALPALVFSSCLLPSFRNVDAASGGSAGVGVGGGNAGSSVAGAAGEGGEAGQNGAEAPVPVSDTFAVLQGATLSVPAPGVLENDEGSSLSVTVIDDSDSGRPAKYDASTLTIDVDGSLEFKPQKDFFGVYTVAYTVQDKDGVTATSTVKIHVQPVAATLAAVRDGIGGFVIDGAANDAIGSAVAGAGDVNHDGFDDVLIGARKAGDNGAGRAYVVYGRAKAANVTLEALPAKSTERAFFDFDGADGDGAGNSVAGIGDINGDGFSDFAVAASTAAPSGTVYVLFGGTLSGGTALSGLPAARGLALTGTTVPIGASIAHAGDVNGDKIPDLLVSGAFGNGHLYVVPGSKKLATSDLDSVAGLFQIEGGAANEALPSSFDCVGNVNDDDKAEVAAGSLASAVVLLGSATGYPTQTGKVSPNGSLDGFRYTLVKHNEPAVVAGAGNVDGDTAQRDDLLLCEELDSGPACRVVFSRPIPFELSAGWNFVGFSEIPRVAHGADLNADGFSDLLFGDGSQVYAALGKKSGHLEVSVGGLGDTDPGFTLATEAAARVDAVVTLGDVNGDTIADYAVGVSTAHGSTGSVYVVFGDKY